jgi:MYXO-CTERM domain-containing protein
LPTDVLCASADAALQISGSGVLIQTFGRIPDVLTDRGVNERSISSDFVERKELIMNLAKRLDKHFAVVAVAAAAASIGLGEKTDAAIVYSGPVNIVIPGNLDGLYMNIVTGQTGSSGGAVAGWDINPYSAGTPANTWFNLWSPSAPTGGVYMNVGGNYNLAFGADIGAASTFANPASTNIAIQMNLNSSNNLIGFRFRHEGNSNLTHYGWFRVEFGADAGTRAIVEYAYEDVAGASIGAGVIPAPGALALLGLAGLASGRRRRA